MALGNPLNFISVRQWKIRAIEQLANIFPVTAEIYAVRQAGGGHEFAPADPAAWKPGFNPVPLTYSPGEELLDLPSESPGTAGFNAAVAGKEFFSGQLLLQDSAGMDVLHTLWLWVVTQYQGPDDTLSHHRQIAYVSHGGISLDCAGHVHADD